MYQRNITDKILIALKDTPVVLLNGARQTGKSTLVKYLVKNIPDAIYYNLDEINTLSAVRQDVSAFINKDNGLVIIDEVQKVPELFNAIKVAVDANRKPGRFLLTGSANVLLLPQISESLAGRMEIISLWPLYQGEINGTKEVFVDRIFTQELPVLKKTISRDKVLDIMLRGGYPEILSRPTHERQQAWFSSYITALLERDIKDVANIDVAIAFPRLLQFLASRSAGLINFAEISRSLSIPKTTLQRYIALLQTAFLIHVVSAWSNNIGRRLIKTPKLFLNDTGLMSYLLGIDKTRIKSNPNFAGPLLENFVVNELKKQLTWSQTNAKLYHYRSQAGHEVDIILENLAGECIGIEVKSASTVTAKDFKGLFSLAETIPEKFLYGIVLYVGNVSLPFGEKLHALPINSLWDCT